MLKSEFLWLIIRPRKLGERCNTIKPSRSLPIPWIFSCNFACNMLQLSFLTENLEGTLLRTIFLSLLIRMIGLLIFCVEKFLRYSAYDVLSCEWSAARHDFYRSWITRCNSALCFLVTSIQSSKRRVHNFVKGYWYGNLQQDTFGLLKWS